VDLNNVSVLVTGGASGLGHATVRALVERGANVVVADLPGSRGADDLLAARVEFVAADITQDSDVAAAFGVARDRGPVRAVVHCAGRGGDRRRLLDAERGPLDVTSFLEVLRVNAGGTFTILTYAAAAMAENEPIDGERGAVVLTASVAAFEGQIGQLAYAASKGAVRSMTIVAARELASLGVRVNTLAPSAFDTAMVGRLRDDVKAELSRGVPFPRRLGRADEFAHLALALLENSYVNGETVRLDGAVRLPPR
jgi:NAD(P)-dependent dehydrogenase (short-subunit alcohol dehydrogenase family)